MRVIESITFAEYRAVSVLLQRGKYYTRAFYFI